MPRTYTYKDVMERCNRGESLLIIHGKVYDVTSFMDHHPGGRDKLLSAVKRGEDSTPDFNKVSDHWKDPRVKEQMEKCCKGDIDMPTVPVRKTHKPKKFYCR